MSERDERRVAEAGERLEREADKLQARGDRLERQIDSVRQDFQRKRNDPDVVGLPPTPERADELSAGPEKHSVDPSAPPEEASPAEAESGAAELVEDVVELPGNPGDEGVHGQDPNDTYEERD